MHIVHVCMYAFTLPARSTRARVGADEVVTRAAVLTGLRHTLVHVLLALGPRPAGATYARVGRYGIQASAAIQAWTADTLICGIVGRWCL